MPCNSDYLEPTAYEKSIHETVKNLIYLYNRLNVQPPDDLVQAYSKIYFDKKEGDKWVSLLCKTIRNMPEEWKESIIYDAKSKKSRRLADWWEDHEEADKKREEEELKNSKFLVVFGDEGGAHLNDQVDLSFKNLDEAVELLLENEEEYPVIQIYVVKENGLELYREANFL